MNKTTNYTPFSNLLGALGPPLFHVSKVIRIAPQWGNLDHFGSFLKKGALGALMNEKKQQYWSKTWSKVYCLQKINSINITKEPNRGIVNTKRNVERVNINQMVFRENKIAVVYMALFFCYWSWISFFGHLLQRLLRKIQGIAAKHV